MKIRVLVSSLSAVLLFSTITFAENREEARARLGAQGIEINIAARPELDKSVTASLEKCYTDIKGSRDVIAKAAGVLVFPKVTKGGLLLGIESGEGALLEKGTTTGYYSTSSASIGATAGMSSKALVLAFLSRDDLKKFKESAGWKVGVDGAVTVAKIGASGAVDTNLFEKGTAAFVYGESGLLMDVSLDGTKISRLENK